MGNHTSMHNPPITLLMPILNGMPFLPSALASIEAQDYKNWKIMVWDNGSTDGSLKELCRWIPSRLPGRIITGSPLSVGLSSARLVEQADTELCARMDADDVIYPERLRLQVDFMERHPSVAVVGTRIEFIDEAGCFWPHADPYPTTDAEIRWELRWGVPIAGASVMFRRSAVLKSGNYRDLRIGEDYDLWFRVGLISEMANLPGVLYQYRQHSKNATAQADFPFYRRAVAELNASSLFPGLPPEEALRVRQIAIRDTHLPVQFADLRVYRRAAIRAALSLGKPVAYFLSTRSCKQHFRELLRNYLLQFRAVRAAVALKRQVHI